jgi:hypothetical protein
MGEMPSQNGPIQRLKAAVLLLDLTFSRIVTHSREILNTGTSHKTKPNGLLISLFIYALFNDAAAPNITMII